MSGIFNASIFNNSVFNTGAAVVVAGGGGGRRRRSKRDLVYYRRKYPEWDAALPDDPKAYDAAVQAFAVFDDIQARLRAHDEAFAAMLGAVNRAIREATLYVESRTIARMLDEAKAAVEAARDEKLIAMEDEEMGELMEIL